MSITNYELFFEWDDEDEQNKKFDPKVRTLIADLVLAGQRLLGNSFIAACLQGILAQTPINDDNWTTKKASGRLEWVWML